MRTKRFLWGLLVVALAATSSAAAAVERPRLVVGIVVDQMRWDMLYTFADQYGNDGFNRLLREGMSFANTTINYVPTVTAAGHASIYTGTTPAFHGIAANNYRLGDRYISSVEDETVSGVGTTSRQGNRSPRNLIATNIGDQLKIATEGQGRVVGVALKDRAAILPAGHAADGAFWYDNATHAFITSSFYATSLPQWVEQFNHDNAATLSMDLFNKPEGVTMTFALAEAAMDAYNLGNGEACDMLAISISTTDALAHNVGNMTPQVREVYRQLDRDLAAFLNRLDSRVGKGNYLLFLTADHGGTFSEPYLREKRIPTGIWESDSAFRALNAALQARWGIDNLVERQMQFSFYLNNAAIAAAGLQRDTVAAYACRLLENDPQIQWAVDMENISAKSLPSELKEKLLLGYHKPRSGDIYIIPYVGIYAERRGTPGSNHSCHTQSDSHIPLIFMGWHIDAGERFSPTHITDIAPTVCALLHIAPPNASIGVPLF